MIAEKLFATTKESVSKQMVYPEVRNFFASGDIWLVSFALVSAL